MGGRLVGCDGGWVGSESELSLAINKQGMEIYSMLVLAIVTLGAIIIVKQFNLFSFI